MQVPFRRFYDVASGLNVMSIFSMRLMVPGESHLMFLLSLVTAVRTTSSDCFRQSWNTFGSSFTAARHSSSVCVMLAMSSGS